MTNRPTQVWVFDVNRRFYVKGQSGPVWREHWRPETVVDETTRSWVTNHGTKVPKKNRNPRKYAISKEEIDRMEWVNENRYRIGRMVWSCASYDALKEIERILEQAEEDR